MEKVTNVKGQHRLMLATVIALAWPTMLEQLMQTAVQYVDTAMVGSLGTNATAAVGSTTTVNWLVGSTISALGVGFLSFISQARGAGDYARARRAVSQAALSVIVCGLFFTAVTLGLSSYVPAWMQVDEHLRGEAARYFFILYTPMLFRTATIVFGTVLRSGGDTKTPMRVGIVINLVNVSLNFLLIYPTRELTLFGHSFTMIGGGLGVTGAAVASAIAFALGGILMTVALWRNRELSPRGLSLKPDGSILRPCLRVALPNALQRFGTSLGYVVFASIVNHIGDTAIAAHTIANTVESAFYIPGYGMQTAAATLAGESYGAGDRGRLRRVARVIILLEVGMMIISGALLFAFAPAMMSIFSSDPEVIALGATVLCMVALSEPFYGVSIVIEGMMQGLGRTVLPFICNIAGMWGIRIVGTFIFTWVLGYGLVGAWACMIAHNMLLFVMFTIFYLTGKWSPMGRGK